LDIIHHPARKSEWVTVRDPEGTSLKVPSWMLSKSAEDFKIVETPILGLPAILSLLALVPGAWIYNNGSLNDKGDHNGSNGISNSRSGADSAASSDARFTKETCRADGANHSRNSSSRSRSKL
jgi:hypothetical protein